MAATLRARTAPADSAPLALERLRRERLERVRDAMAGADIDAVLLLDPADVSYATGIPWPPADAGRADVEPPVAVVVVDDPVPHLFTPFMADAARLLGMDDDHLHGPAYLDVAEGVEVFSYVLDRCIPWGARVAVDEVTGATALLGAAAVDAGPLLRAVRRTKTADEVDAIHRAVDLAEVGLVAALARSQPGARERDLTEAAVEAMAALGAPRSALQARTRITSACDGRDGGAREVVQDGDLVAVHAGAVVEGYAGEVARTVPVGDGSQRPAVRDLVARSDELRRRLLDACRPGAPASDLLDAYAAAGEPLPVMPIARGLGLGADGPVVVRDLPETAAIERLDPGLVLVLTSCVFDDAVGSIVIREPVHLTTDGPEVLSSMPARNHQRAGAQR